MRLRELFTETAEVAKKKLGRAFNHLEDLVFFHGTEGALEALAHIKEIATEEGSQSIRMKWDGNPQIYWGRETANGPLILSGHNGWARGAKTDNPEDLKDFIANKSGSPKTPEEKQQRDAFAEKFSSLYPAFDAATPKNFVGYVYADALFLDRPQLDDKGVYNFCPNPKSKTCYHVRKDSELGKRISQADVMVVGHAEFDTFGADDSDQTPKDSFEEFNKTSKLIVMGPVYNKKPVQIDTSKIDELINTVSNSKSIDGFLEDTAGLSDLKNIIYTYVNQTAKAKQLANLNPQHFQTWLERSKVSSGKQQKIQQKMSAHPGALESIFSLMKEIQYVKNDMLKQIEGEQGDIWDTNGEGRVRYAGADHKFGNVKFVNRDLWTPGE